MTREEIKRLAREAEVPVGITGGNPTWEQIERFVSLVAAAERKECADVCDRIANLWSDSFSLEGWREGYVDGAGACRNVIRERGKDD